MEAVACDVPRLVPTGDQSRALEMVRALTREPRDRPRTLVISGPAGTGKTTLMRLIREYIGNSVVVAPTGKAALRVQQATGCTATTIHRLLFYAKEDPDTGEVGFRPREPVDIADSDSGVLIVDEASMVSPQLHEQVLVAAYQKGWHVVFLGDGAQLPPVTPELSEPFNILDPAAYGADYRVELNEIVRQAKDNPLIQVLTAIRENRMMAAMKGLREPGVATSHLIEAAAEVSEAEGAVLCHTNQLRSVLNRKIRERFGYGDLAEPDEPLCVSKNNYVVNYFNGEMVRLRRWGNPPRSPTLVQNRYTTPHAKQAVRFGVADVEGDLGGVQGVLLCQEEVAGLLDKGITQAAIARAGRKKANLTEASLSVLHAEYGYAITCHRAQGSEWGEVLVVLDKLPLHSTYGRRWLYTAMSRAKERVRLCFYDGSLG